MKELIKKYRHAWVAVYFLLYGPWFIWLEHTVTRDFHVIHTALDDMIPFCEYFIVPYLLWFVYMFGTVFYFFFKNTRDFYRVCTYLFVGMTVCLMICTVFHNGTDMRPVIDPNKNVFTWLVSVLQRVDTSTNIFPSIHVFDSVAMHVAVMKSDDLKKHPYFQKFSLVLCILICASTVFLKQHSVVDVMGALVLAYLLYPMAYGSSYATEERRFRRKALG